MGCPSLTGGSQSARSFVSSALQTQVMNLEDWLSATNKALNAHSLKDAWAHGDTDCAFHINDVVGIQNSNRGNDWRIWGGSRGDLAQACLCAYQVGPPGGGSSSELIWPSTDVCSRVLRPRLCALAGLVGGNLPQPCRCLRYHLGPASLCQVLHTTGRWTSEADPDSSEPVAAHVVSLTLRYRASVQIYHDNGKNYGTYFNLQSENMIQEVLHIIPPRAS